MSDGGDVIAEVPAASPPAEALPEVITPAAEIAVPETVAPAPEVPTVSETATSEEPTVQVIEGPEIQAAPAAPEPPAAPAPLATPETPRSEPESASLPSPEPQPSTQAPLASEPPKEQPSPLPFSIASLLPQALEAIRFRKRARLDKILQLAAKKGRIKNDDVEKLLRVSDSTAQRYLNQLVVAAKLRRVGHAKQPTYEPL